MEEQNIPYLIKVVNEVFGKSYISTGQIEWDSIFSGLPSSIFLDFLIEFEDSIGHRVWRNILSSSLMTPAILGRFSGHVPFDTMFSSVEMSEVSLRCYCEKYSLTPHYWYLIAQNQTLSESFLKDYHRELYSFRSSLKPEERRVVEDAFRETRNKV